MRAVGKEIWLIIKNNFKQVILFEFIYRIITIPLYLALLEQMINFSLDMAGYSYLTAGNIGAFLMQPWTLAAVLIMGGLGLVLLFVEMAGLITAFQGAAYSRKPALSELFMGGISKLRDEFARKNWKIMFFVFIHYILMQLYVIYRVLTHIKPINFVLESAMGDPVARIAAVLIFLLLVFLAVPSIFIFHECTIEQKSFRDGFSKSVELIKGKVWKTMLIMTMLDGIIVLAVVGIYVICMGAIAVGVVLFTNGGMALAVLLYSGDRVEIILLLLGSIALVIGNLAASTVLYYQYSSRKSHDTSWEFSYPVRAVKNRRVVLGAVGVLCAASLFYISNIVRNGFTIANEVLIEMQITAHRGSSKTAPENTMAALSAAVDELADYVEIDVQESKDGRLVLLHDANLKRTAGVNRGVKTMTYEELMALDVGSWFAGEFKGEKIPTLEEVIAFSKGKVLLNIEIKNVGKDSLLPDKVFEAIEAFEIQEQCVVSSTNLNYLKRMKELNPDIRTGYIVSAAYGDYYSNENIDFISLRSSFVNERLIEAAHRHGKAVHAWTVNSKSEIERMRMLGVDNVITDYPVLAREVVYGETVTENLLDYLRLVLN